MKKGKITAIESACIKGMIANNVSIGDMATQLDRGLATMEKEVERIKADSVREQLFINKTASGSKGVSVMTEAASTRGDTARDRQPVVTTKEGRPPSIHKIRNDG
tara:strand:- start:242 stop:556 length:315 start_codon:yes stop_codon:yes gene_type:complete